VPRFTFWQLFRRIDDNTLEVLRKIKVGGVEFSPGVRIGKGAIVAGIDFFRYLNADIEGDEENDALIIKRIYPQ
jgi:hypothetical protein